jgi:PAS domain S-box-containing protein
MDGCAGRCIGFVVFPLVVWAALRFRIAGAALTSLLAASVAVWGTARGLGPFVNHTPLHNAVLLQIFVAVISLTGLILAAVINEREHIGEAFESEKKLLNESEALKGALEELVRERTAELERNTAQLAYQAKLLDLANDAILVRTTDARITYWNEGAEHLYGWTKAEALGKSTEELIHTEFPQDVAYIFALDRWEGELRQQRRDGSQVTVASRWTTLHDSDGRPAGWLEINTDITSRKRAEDAARALSGRILTLQDEERRRIAKGLHDSLGQYLAALKMNLDGFPSPTSAQAAVVSEFSEIVQKCLTETRTISYLLHPPLLDESGFGSAARWYVEGFARRSGIEVNLDLPQELMRLHPDVEIALFRAVQESLTNIHKHANSSLVDIRMTQDVKQVRLEIADNGQGIPKERLKRLLEGAAEVGVGIAGTRERFRELAGSVEIRSSRKGTTVIVTAPVPQAVAPTEESESTRRVSAA